MNVDAYLKRIRYRGSLEPTATTLRELQLAHLGSVPFENLSIHSNEVIVLDEQSLFQKIVLRNRGGFCYEVNGLFAALLRDLGFNVVMLSAEVAKADSTYSAPFDHMTLLVQLEERWLADVGFGDSFLEPLRLDERDEQKQGACTYRIDQDEEYFVLLQRIEGEEWKAQYRFTLQPRVFADFDARCHYQQTSPESHFTQNRICTLVTTEGRVTLSDTRLITTAHGNRTERPLTDSDYAAVLREQFGIVLKN